MTRIRLVLGRVKEDAAALLDPQRVVRACVAAGHTWRMREFDPVMTISVMMLQVLHATSGRGALRAARLGVTPTAYCKAKQRLPMDVVHRLVFDLAERVRSTREGMGDAARWRGHRTVMVDGSSSSMPDTPALQKAFGQPASMKDGCGFPVMHLLALFDQATGMIIDLLTHRHNTHDMAHVARLHPMLERGDVLVGDRGFCSYAHLALLLQDKLHGVFRLHQRKIVRFKRGRKSRRPVPKGQRTGRATSRFIRRLGHNDQIVDYLKPARRPRWMEEQTYAALPQTIRVRELGYRIKRDGVRTHEVTLVTTLLDVEKYPKAALEKLYESRWEVETRLLEFKQTLGGNVLRSKSVEGVLKDIWMHVLVYNLLRLLMLRHAIERGSDPRRLSFIDARDVMRYASRDDVIPTLMFNAKRRPRDEPRVIKRRKDRYTLMTRPRETLRQTLGIKKDAA